MECIFCKIVKGEIASCKVYEDENFLAFLDINPQSPGHTQVITKIHYRWVWDVPNAGEYFGTDFILSKIIGDEVRHAHIWIFPNSGVSGDPKDFLGNAEKILQFLS